MISAWSVVAIVVAEGVSAGDLVKLRSFDDGLPVEGIDGVGSAATRDEIRAVVVAGLGELKGLSGARDSERSRARRLRGERRWPSSVRGRLVGGRRLRC